MKGGIFLSLWCLLTLVASLKNNQWILILNLQEEKKKKKKKNSKNQVYLFFAKLTREYCYTKHIPAFSSGSDPFSIGLNICICT